MRELWIDSLWGHMGVLRFEQFSLDSTGPVFPGDELITIMWVYFWALCCFSLIPHFCVGSPASRRRAGCSLLGSFKVKGYQIIHLALRYCVGCFWSFRSPYGLWNQFIDIAKIISWDLGNWIRRSCISASNLLILEPDASLLLLQSSTSFSHQGLYFFL